MKGGYFLNVCCSEMEKENAAVPLRITIIKHHTQFTQKIGKITIVF